MTEERPFPVPDADTEPFWAGCREGVLRIQRCRGCGRHAFYPRSVCPHCTFGELEWVAASGRATLYAFTVVHRTSPEFAHQVPFPIGLVDLQEGVRMMAPLKAAAPRVGMALRATFAEVGDWAHPVFEEVSA